jgi:hypothetical protein
LRSCGHHLFDGGACGFRALLMSRGLALQLRYEFFNSGGWATNPSRLPHCVPLAFVALLDGLRRRHLLHTRKISHQQVNLHDGYPTTLVRTSYLLRRDLRDLQLLRHPLVGGVARLPWRRSHASLQASRRILYEGYMRQAGTAKPRPQLEAVLQRLLVVVLLGRVFYDDGVISLALAFPSFRISIP